MIQLTAGIIFLLTYLVIIFEHKLKLNKSAIALFGGALLWIIVAITKQPHFETELAHTGNEIFSIVVFLLAAMSLVEILVHYKFFDLIRAKLYQLKLDDKAQFLIITAIIFLLSAVIDNLTATIVGIQIARKFFKGNNLLYTASGIVIAANAGGAFSPIGDVTTIMIWLADKFNALEIIKDGFLPSLTMYIVSSLMIYKKIKNDTKDNDEIIKNLSKSEWAIVVLTLLSFSFPVIMSFNNLPPYMGLLIGLGLVWLLTDLLKVVRPKPTHLSCDISQMIKNTDIPSLKFFIGILLAVAALNNLEILKMLSEYLYGHNPSELRIIGGNAGLGLLSAIVDNVPLTAIAIKMLEVHDPNIWVLLAICVGTGGSLFIIGSAAGVVAMGMVKELNFTKYLKLVSFPVIIAYLAAIGVWLIQYYLL